MHKNTPSSPIVSCGHPLTGIFLGSSLDQIVHQPGLSAGPCSSLEGHRKLPPDLAIQPAARAPETVLNSNQGFGVQACHALLKAVQCRRILDVGQSERGLGLVLGLPITERCPRCTGTECIRSTHLAFARGSISRHYLQLWRASRFRCG